MKFKVIDDFLPTSEQLDAERAIKKHEAKERADKVRWISAEEILKAREEARAGKTISLNELRRRIEGSVRR
ncbi:MAG: hypothetical protein A3F87_01400 [Omnitrophica WOR_2 bacterium RIFCSPLOWO2_12_FULL_51_24]|nr:MAG: hypothetical protein A3I43_00730 [Omnitrophica WOR_2 bacterium RIFCSPLOWO2_02_FULL_50_19]OGX42428.1 MAG: hypothetical protein A3F87_01400 [Omnitrophica WOR_2 bacterium RIFCSPLOWO2_12_FULL_51_24]